MNRGSFFFLLFFTVQAQGQGMFTTGFTQYNPVDCVGSFDFSQVPLVLHMDGTVASTVFLDATGKTAIVNSGTPSIAASGNYLQKGSFSSGYLTMNSQAGLVLGSSDFTLEFWLNPTAGSSPGLLWNAAGQTNAFGAIAVTEAGVVNFSSNGTSWTGSVALSLTNSVWSHVAISRQGASIYVFQNGGLKGTYSIGAGVALHSGTYNTVGAYLGGSTGFMDELRLTLGTGLYSSVGYAVPTTTFCSYSTWNPNDKGTGTLSNNNLTFLGSNTKSVRSTTSHRSGKWYFEVRFDSNTGVNTPLIGLAMGTANISWYPGYDTKGWSYYAAGHKYNNNIGTAYGATYGTGAIISVAYDADNGKVYFAKDCTWQNSSDPAAGTNPAFTGLPIGLFAMVGGGSTGNTCTTTANFGLTAFTCPVPAGYTAGW
jgi:hypothetical protein